MSVEGLGSPEPSRFMTQMQLREWSAKNSAPSYSAG
jgi:hypothetical protein